jgi:hypothetical protein
MDQHLPVNTNATTSHLKSQRTYIKKEEDDFIKVLHLKLAGVYNSCQYFRDQVGDRDTLWDVCTTTGYFMGRMYNHIWSIKSKHGYLPGVAAPKLHSIPVWPIGLCRR